MSHPGKRLTLVEPAPGHGRGPSRDYKLWVICPALPRLGQQALKEGRPGVHNSIYHIKAFMKRKKNCKPCQKLCLICATFQSLHDFYSALYTNVIPPELSLTNLSKMDFFYVLHCSRCLSLPDILIYIYIYLFIGGVIYAPHWNITQRSNFVLFTTYPQCLEKCRKNNIFINNQFT